MSTETRTPYLENLGQALFDSPLVGVYVVDAAGRIVEANAAFARMAGRAAAELAGKALEEVLEGEPGERGPVAEARLKRRDGTVGAARIAARALGDGRSVALVQDISELRQSEQRELHEERALLEAAYELQSLARRLVQAEEMERHRVAGELHDRVGQALSALNINLDIALGSVPPASRELKLRIADSLALVEGTLQTIENLMAELRPPLLEEYGLAAALSLHAKGFTQRTGVPVAVDDPEELGKGLKPVAANALFRIAQEALANVAKHAQARKVRIVIERQDNGLVMEIADNGRGFDVRQRLARSQRWGVTTMQERAAAAGGVLEVDSTIGGGTSVRVRMPAAQSGETR